MSLNQSLSEGRLQPDDYVDDRPMVHADDSIDMDHGLRTLADAAKRFDDLLTEGGGWPSFKEDQEAFYEAWGRVQRAAGELWVEGERD